VTKIIAYLAHPVSAPDQAGIDANLANARAWLKFLVDSTSWAVSAPWMPYVEALAEATYRERGLADDLAMLERHDLIVLVGGRISSGMELERGRAYDCGLRIVDLTSMGASPPVAYSVAETAIRQHLYLVEQLNFADGARR